MLDLLVMGGDVIDGTGASVQRADVGVVDGRIAVVGDLGHAEAKTVIDADGAVVTPGFIDAHAHTDLSHLALDEGSDLRVASVLQGVTTEVCGNCGWTPYPRTAAYAAAVDRHIGGAWPGPAHVLDSYRAFRAAAGAQPLATNLAPLVGHGTIRAAAMGLDDRQPTEGELRAMERLTAEAMDDGAFGLSSGLMYPPGVYARTEELVVLARVAARFGRLYATHMRDEADHVLASIDEALRVGADAGLPVQISHHKVAGRRNWGRTAETLAAIERAQAGGQDVTVDVYPYTAGSTFLRALLPPWVNAGGVEALLERVGDAATVARVARDFEVGIEGWQDLATLAGWANVTVASTKCPAYEGRSIADLATERGMGDVEFVCRLLAEEDGGPIVVLHLMDEADVRAVLSRPYAMIGSDGIAVPGKPHPRLAGTFARVLGRYTGRDGLFDLCEAVRKMTSLPAARFGLEGRGVIARGKVADLVVFDRQCVLDAATYAEPLLPPAGIAHVIMGGVVAIEAGRDTGARAGRVLDPS